MFYSFLSAIAKEELNGLPVFTLKATLSVLLLIDNLQEAKLCFKANKDKIKICYRHLTFIQPAVAVKISFSGAKQNFNKSIDFLREDSFKFYKILPGPRTFF